MGTPTSLCIQSNDTVNFGTGHYTYTNGIECVRVGERALRRRTGHQRLSARLARRAGVFFYVTGGATDLGNINFATNIQLGPHLGVNTSPTSSTSPAVAGRR